MQDIVLTCENPVKLQEAITRFEMKHHIVSKRTEKNKCIIRYSK